MSTPDNNIETSRILVEAARYHYDNAEKRWSHLVSKIQVLITATSLLLALLGFTQPKFSCSKVLNNSSILFALVSIFVLVCLLKNTTSSKPALGNINVTEELEKPLKEVSGNLTKSYLSASIKTGQAVDTLYKKYDWAVCLVLLTILLKIISLLLEFSEKNG